MDKHETATPKTLNPSDWVDKYADYLFSFANYRVNDPDLAQDLVQDTFLSALNAREGFKGEASEKTWLVSILKRKIIDQYRKNAVRKEQSFGESEQFKVAYGHYFTEEGFIPGDWHKTNGPKEWGVDETDPADKNEFRKIMGLCLSKLPKNWSSVFSLKYMDDETSETICKELNISPSNFWVIIHRAKLQLRECLEKNWLKS